MVLAIMMICFMYGKLSLYNCLIIQIALLYHKHLCESKEGCKVTSSWLQVMSIQNTALVKALLSPTHHQSVVALNSIVIYQLIATVLIVAAFR